MHEIRMDITTTCQLNHPPSTTTQQIFTPASQSVLFQSCYYKQRKMYISSRSSEPRDLTAIYGHVQSEEEARPRQELFRVVFQHQPPSPSFLAVNFL